MLRVPAEEPSAREAIVAGRWLARQRPLRVVGRRDTDPDPSLAPIAAPGAEPGAGTFVYGSGGEPGKMRPTTGNPTGPSEIGMTAHSK